MSITFWMPQAPQVRIEPYPEDEPGYYETIPAKPFSEVNMANSNAYALMQLIDPAADPDCGTWQGDKLHSIRKSLMRLLNLKPEQFCAADFVDGNLHSCGRDMDYVTRRLNDMLVLVVVAIENDFSICYG